MLLDFGLQTLFFEASACTYICPSKAEVSLRLFLFICITFQQAILTQKTLEKSLHNKVDDDKCLSMHMFRPVMCAYHKNIL